LMWCAAGIAARLKCLRGSIGDPPIKFIIELTLFYSTSHWIMVPQYATRITTCNIQTENTGPLITESFYRWPSHDYCDEQCTPQRVVAHQRADISSATWKCIADTNSFKTFRWEIMEFLWVTPCTFSTLTKHLVTTAGTAYVCWVGWTVEGMYSVLCIWHPKGEVSKTQTMMTLTNGITRGRPGVCEYHWESGISALYRPPPATIGVGIPLVTFCAVRHLTY
jgi:hypothetical protein